ncbi:hypothetical protein BC830DRAFT_1084023 [Chytriomyces sp. MP71]|nr:hypothetical protein BC830DRAFT_1084023 [Chytriomyces sp. MP71]
MDIVTSDADVADVGDATGCSFHSPFLSKDHVIGASRMHTNQGPSRTHKIIYAMNAWTSNRSSPRPLYASAEIATGSEKVWRALEEYALRVLDEEILSMESHGLDGIRFSRLTTKGDTLPTSALQQRRETYTFVEGFGCGIKGRGRPSLWTDGRPRSQTHALGSEPTVFVIDRYADLFDFRMNCFLFHPF